MSFQKHAKKLRVEQTNFHSLWKITERGNKMGNMIIIYCVVGLITAVIFSVFFVLLHDYQFTDWDDFLSAGVMGFLVGMVWPISIVIAIVAVITSRIIKFIQNYKGE
jgi:hypothetical protein